MKIPSILLLLLFAFPLHAQTPFLTDLDRTEINDALTDLSSVFVPTTVSPASNLGDLWGMEVGLILGVVDTPRLKSLTDSVSNQDSVDSLPVGAGFLRVDIPFGLGAEIGNLPVDVDDFTADYTFIGAKWTFSDVFDWPVDMRLKFNYATADLEWRETNSSGLSSIFSYENKSTTLSLTISKNFLIVEPWAGIGLTDSKNSLNATGSLSVFNATVTAADRTDIGVSDTFLFAGVQLNLFLIKIGAEWMNVYGNNKIMGKFSLAF